MTSDDQTLRTAQALIEAHLAGIRERQGPDPAIQTCLDTQEQLESLRHRLVEPVIGSVGAIRREAGGLAIEILVADFRYARHPEPPRIFQRVHIVPAQDVRRTESAPHTRDSAPEPPIVHD